MHELHELIMGWGSRRSRHSWTVQVQVECLEERVVLSAALDAVNFASAMLNKLTVGDHATTGPYPEEGFRTGGRRELANYLRDVINSFADAADVYVPKLNEFAPQFYFNDTSPNRARDHWVRDFAHLEVMAGATSSFSAASQPSLEHLDAIFADPSSLAVTTNSTRSTSPAKTCQDAGGHWHKDEKVCHFHCGDDCYG